MKRTLVLLITALFSLLILTACAQEEMALPTRAALAEVETPASQPETGKTMAPVTESEPLPPAQAIDEEIETGERPLLPNLAAAPVGSGYEAGLGGSNIAAGMVSSAPEFANPFEAATFSLNVTLPTGLIEAQVWQQPAIPLDSARAKTIAERWGFAGPLYRFATPDETIVSEPVYLEAAQLPANLLEFHVFDGTRSLVITEDAAYFSDDGVAFDYETPRPFAERSPAAEAVLQSMGLLDFSYILEDGWGHEVWVNRELDGMGTNYPEISAGVGENGRLAFASYQPFDQLTAIAAYPLISAEAAWQQIQDGVDENILFTITPAAEEPELPSDPILSSFQYWPREHQTGQEVHLYTYPTVFLPVDEGIPPLVNALNYTVHTDDDTLYTLADQLGVNVHFWGTLDTQTNSLALAGWEPLPELNPLIKNGVIQRQGAQTLFIDPSGGTFILPDAPAELADGSQVNVFAWAARDAGQTYPVLDWEGIDMQIPESSGEMIAMPEILPPASPVYEQISITQAKLAYYVYPEFQEGENGRYQQSYWLLPVWQLTGLADNGDTITFSVQATENY